MQNDLKKALEVLKGGGILLYPADTGWCLGCDATSHAAVERILQFNPPKDVSEMPVLMENPALLDRYVEDVPELAWDLVEISNTPLTLIFPQAKNVAANLQAPDGSIAIRFTREAFTVRLLQRFRRPLLAVSAPGHGDGEPVFFEDIAEEVKHQVDYVVEYGRQERMPTQPAGIIKLWPNGRIEILRQ